MATIKIKEEFSQHIQGSNELYLWKISIENDFENGKKVNKRKYHKICILYEERRGKAGELLDTINRLNPRIKTCMPPHLPPSIQKQTSQRSDN